MNLEDIDKAYVSPYDEFLAKFDSTHELSESQLKEIKTFRLRYIFLSVFYRHLTSSVLLYKLNSSMNNKKINAITYNSLVILEFRLSTCFSFAFSSLFLSPAHVRR